MVKICLAKIGKNDATGAATGNHFDSTCLLVCKMDAQAALPWWLVENLLNFAAQKVPNPCTFARYKKP